MSGACKFCGGAETLGRLRHLRLLRMLQPARH